MNTSAGSQPLRRWWRSWSQLRLGTLLIVNVEDRAATLAFTQKEPFHQAGVFDSVVVRCWRQMQLEVSLSANAGTAIAMYLKEVAPASLEQPLCQPLAMKDANGR